MGSVQHSMFPNAAAMVDPVELDEQREEAVKQAVEQQETLGRLSDQIQPLVQDAFKAAGPR